MPQEKAGRLLKIHVEVVKAWIEAGVVAKAGDVNDDEAVNIADEIMDALRGLFGDISNGEIQPLEDAALAGIEKGTRNLDITDDDMISSLNDGARDWAGDRAAELVGMRKLDDGSVVENPNAKWAITDTTRDDLRRIISNGFTKDTPMPDLISQIGEAGAFSDTRAEAIAKTEVLLAQVNANMDVWKESGVVDGSTWTTSVNDNVCDDCDGNDGETVPLGEEFPSGDVMPPAHTNCQCGLVASMGKVSKGWVTINGAHVLINDAGVITEGPKGLIGQSPRRPTSTPRDRERELEQDIPGAKNFTPLGDKHVAVVQKYTMANGKKAVFKPHDGEGNTARHREGSISPGFQTEREVGAWEVAKVVGMDDMVAPTRDMTLKDVPQVTRQADPKDPTFGEKTIGGPGTRTRGAVMEWQPGEQASKIRGAAKFDGDDNAGRAAAFDYVIGNTDRHGGNWNVDKDEKMHLIDHGLAFPDKGDCDPRRRRAQPRRQQRAIRRARPRPS